MTIEKKQIYSRGGYSVWKNEFYNPSEEEKSKKILQKPFIVKNCFRTNIEYFDTQEEAIDFIIEKNQRGKLIREFLQKGANLVQVLLFVGFLLSLLVGYLIPFFYFSNTNEMWLLPKMIGENSIKLFFIGFVLSIFIFYLPVLYGYLLANFKIKIKNKWYQFRLPGETTPDPTPEDLFPADGTTASSNGQPYPLNRYNECLSILLYILALLGGVLINFILTWMAFEQVLMVRIVTIYYKVIIGYAIILFFMIWFSFGLFKKNKSEGFAFIPKISVVLILPLLIFPMSELTNFSKVVFKMTGMGARINSLQFPSEDLSTLDPTLRTILYRLNAYPGQNMKYCIFAQTNDNIYVVDPSNKKSTDYCSDPSFSGPVGTLIRVPMKYIVSIGN